MKAGSILLMLGALLSLSSCADLISSLRQESREADEAAEQDRDPAQAEEAVRQRARTLRGLSANNVSEYEPPATRDYRRRMSGRLGQVQESAANGERRFTRNDFVDRVAHENSLWDAQGQNNYLFANNRRRESGDMITVDVERDLRREIQYQLWLTLPPEQRRSRRPAEKAASDTVSSAAGAPEAADAAKAAGDKSQETRNKDAAEEAAKSNLAQAPGEPDVVRMEVVESLGNGLVRVLGQKRVVYRGISRVVEVSAIINDKDVSDANQAKSSSFLDMKAQVVQ